MSHTVSTLPLADLAAYRKALKSRASTVRSQSDSRFKKALKIADRAALLLKEEFGVKKVVVFGSLLDPSLFHLRSDIDLVVWGLAGRNYYRAVGVLQSLDPDIKIDLVVFEDASKSIQETVLQTGKEL
jgi:uncharacterized protein